MFCTQNRDIANATGGQWQAAARSLHTGGVNVVMADGSVRFVSNSINQATFSALGTAMGGEVATLE
jgi:prepilin-type processing-associated H-X9-DG protein